MILNLLKYFNKLYKNDILLIIYFRIKKLHDFLSNVVFYTSVFQCIKLYKTIKKWFKTIKNLKSSFRFNENEDSMKSLNNLMFLRSYMKSLPLT